MKIFLSLLLLPATLAFSVSRRACLLGISSAVPAAIAQAATCPPKSNNCLVTTWTAPTGTTDVKASLNAIINSYPQEGQNKVDLGGYTQVGETAFEFRSGIGNFAKFLNGGKPFVDDLTYEVVAGNDVIIKSASRIGDSDLGVNQKRLMYLAEAAAQKGWTTVATPKY